MKRWSARLVNASMILYLIWLLIPAVQTTGGAVAGAACVGLFGLGVALDWEHFKAHWWDLLLRAACTVVLPLLLRKFLDRGGPNFLGFYVQQVMFWFPLVVAGYVRQKGDKRLWQWTQWVLLGCVVLTVCTTIGWLIQGMLRGGRVYAYSRSLGFAGEGREAYLKELMLRNIGGYDFVYAMTAALPLTCLWIQRSRKRWMPILLLIAQTVMVVLSQYTYAMLFAAGVLALEGVALLIRRKWKMSLGKSLLWAMTPFVLAIVFAVPLVSLAATVCQSLGLTNFAHSFEQLLLAVQGQVTAEDSRLSYYLVALRGFAASPLIGGSGLLSGHSDLLDLLSGMGVLGAALVSAMLWWMGRGMLAGVKRHPQGAQIWVSFAVVGITALLGTVVYSRDIAAVVCMGCLLILEGEQA